MDNNSGRGGGGYLSAICSHGGLVGNSTSPGQSIQESFVHWVICGWHDINRGCIDAGVYLWLDLQSYSQYFRQSVVD